MNAVPPPPGVPPPPPPPPPALRPPPPYVDPSLLQPSRAWYWVAGVVGVVSAAIAVALFVNAAGSLVDDLTGPLTEFDSPGSATIVLESDAERTIYRQLRDDSVVIRGASAARPACTVTSPDGSRVELRNPFEWTLDRGEDRYEALYAFKATQAGGYRVACSGDEVPLAVGEHLGLLALLGGIAAALAALFVGVGAAIAIALVTAIRRDSHKRKLQHQAREHAALGLG